MTSPTASKKFRTFSGVFVPNVLTILGVILFMRSGWVVGQAGVKDALLILVIANSITLLTSLSLSAIATNIKVGGGGAYYLISRSLGLEIGGSIGLPLFLAQAVSVAFYIVGFTESISPFFPEQNTVVIALIVLGLIFILSWVSSSLALKAQNLILVVLILSLGSFFFHWEPVSHFAENWEPAYRDGFEFWTVFAIFFPAVTGIMNGASMSGDLREPSKSIPWGTLAAVAVTFVVYVLQLLMLGRNGDREALLGDAMVMKELSVFGPLIYAGLWAATLSSAIASLLGAPRTLQALALDGVLPRFLGRKFGRDAEPRIALVVSGIIALVCLCVGDLNVIAPVISMFFLATYGMVNFVAGLEAWSANPSFRPAFRVHWSFSVLGAAGCMFVMFLLSPYATVLAIVLMAGLYIYLHHRGYQTAWGDTWSGVWFSMIRVGLLKFYKSSYHIRNWRPVLLVLSGNPRVRTRLVQFAQWFECKRGFLFLAQVLTGDWYTTLARRDAARETIDKFIQRSQLSAEAQVVISPDFASGVSSLVQTTGVGPLIPNAVLVGWSDDAVKKSLFKQTVRRILELKRSLLLYVEARQKTEELNPVIDVWWAAKVNGTLMLTLAHLLRSNVEWKRHRVRLLIIVRNQKGETEARTRLEAYLKEARIRGNVEVVVSEKPPLEVIARESSLSAVTFVGFNLDSLQEDHDPLDPFNIFVKSFRGHVFLTKNWEELKMS